MPLNSKLLESYGSVHTNLNESGLLQSAKEKVLELFRGKAKDGIIKADNTDFTEDMVKGALETCGDQATINDLVSFLGLGGGAIAEAKGASIPPEQVGESVRRHAEESNFERIVITTHYGDMELPVAEIWSSEGTLHLSVDLPDTNL